VAAHSIDIKIIEIEIKLTYIRINLETLNSDFDDEMILNELDELNS